MSAIDIWKIGEPWLDVLPSTSLGQFMEVLPPSGVVAVARFDGATMIDADDVFRQFADALRFPAYFGWNWDALSDCLRDLRWCPADRYLIIIENTELVLLASAEERDLMFDILGQAAEEWANPLGKPGGNGVVFRVVLVCADEAADSFRTAIASR
jgi:Barstar (barnase inhibitor)